jgi:hypothetical protein
MASKSENHWREHVSRWKESGLSRNKYCIKNKLYHSTLTNWIKRIEKQTKPVKITLPKTVPSTTNEIVIEGKGFSIKVPLSVDPGLLKIIIRELK